jgi:MFS family permease
MDSEAVARADASTAEVVALEAAPVAARSYPPAIQGWYAVFALGLAVMVNFLDRGIFTLLVKPIKADLHLSDVQMSLVMGFAFTFFYAILGLPVARLVDRGNRKRIMAVGIAIWSAMTALCGFAANFWHLFAGETTSGPSAYSMLSDFFPPERLPRAIAGMNIGFVAGSGLSLVLGAVVIGFVGNSPEVVIPVLGTFRSWQVVLLLVGTPGLLVAAIMLSVREPPRHGVAHRESQPVMEVFALMRTHWRVFIPMFAGLALRSVQMFGLQMWGPTFYQRTYGWSATQIGYVSGLSIMVAMPVGLFLGSWLSERYWKKGRFDANIRVVVFSTLISAPVAVLAPLSPSPWLYAGIALVNTVFLGMAAPVENAALQSVTPNRMRGQMTFLFLFIMNVIGMGLGPLFVATLSQYAFGEAAIRYSIMLTAAVLGLPAAFVFWYGMRPYGEAMKRGGVEESLT